jgi:hypothetical protein
MSAPWLLLPFVVGACRRARRPADDVRAGRAMARRALGPDILVVLPARDYAEVIAGLALTVVLAVAIACARTVRRAV